MSGVLLIGAGPPPGPTTAVTDFGALRTWAFAAALRGDGHPVHVVWITAPDEAPPLEALAPGDHVLTPAEALRAGPVEAIGADAALVVSAGPHLPGRVAARVAGERPWLADVPGDPFAEAQALALRGALSAAGWADAVQAARAVLARADRLGAISGPQADALRGQLLAAGRARDAAAPVVALPNVYAFPHAPGPPRVRAPGAPLRVLVAGTPNAWLDAEVLAAGLESALRARPAVTVTVTGAPRAGQPAGAHAPLAALAAAHPGRVRASGWLAPGAFDAVVRASDLLVWMDRPGDEPRLGCRTRALFGAWCGLALVGTARAALPAALAAVGGLTAVAEGSAAALGAALVAAVDAGDDGAQTARAQAWLAAHHAPAVALAPLLAFARSPARHPAADDPLPAAHDALLAELLAVRARPTIRAANAVHRRLLAWKGRFGGTPRG